MSTRPGCWACAIMKPVPPISSAPAMRHAASLIMVLSFVLPNQESKALGERSTVSDVGLTSFQRSVAVKTMKILAVAATSMMLPISVAAETTLAGRVMTVDLHRGTITIRLQDGQTQVYRPSDGMLFNAVKRGDRVSFTLG